MNSKPGGALKRPLLLLRVHRRKLLVHVVPVILSLVVGVILTLHAGQDMNWDLLNYHFYAPYSLLHTVSGRNFAPSMLQTYYNPLLDVVGYWLITHTQPIVADTTLGALQGLNLWLVYEIMLTLFARARRQHPRLLPLFAFIVAVCSFIGAINRGEVGTTKGDNMVSILVLLGFWLLLLVIGQKNAWVTKHARSVRCLAYAVVGLAVGLKLTEGTFAVALLAIELVNIKQWRTVIKRIVLGSCSLFVGFLLSYGFWGVYLYKHFKNPFFPYFNSLFGSPYFPRHSVEGALNYPHGVMQTIFFPFYFLKSPAFAIDPRFAILYIAVAVLIGYVIACRFIHQLPKPTISRELVLLLIFLVVSYILWEIVYSYYRYAAVIEFLALVAITAIIWSICHALKKTVWLSLIVIAVITVTTVPMDFGRIPWQSSYFGVQLPSHYLTKNATVLMVGGGPTAFLIPSFPSDDTFIRVGGNIGVRPNPPQTATYKKAIMGDIVTQSRHHSTFFALEATGTYSTVDASDIKTVGFTVDSCQSIGSFESTYMEHDPAYYQLCRLTKT